MSGIAIYVEGGGDGNAGRAALRNGFDAFLKPLKDLVRGKRMGWKLVPCGGRIEACNAFFHAVQAGENTHIFLLVDSEQPVKGGKVAHLIHRDGQSQLAGSSEDRVHLMVQTMEAWIIADMASLSAYYGQGFAASALPRRTDLEAVEKTGIAEALVSATRNTSKGPYQKIRDASELLQRLNPTIVQSRCPSCARFFKELASAIETV